MKKDLDYSQIRGFNYSDWQDVSEEKQRREFGYACSLRMNSVRIWLQYGHYCQDPEGYVEKLKRFVRTGHEMGISSASMIISPPAGQSGKPMRRQSEYRKPAKNLSSTVNYAVCAGQIRMIWPWISVGSTMRAGICLNS